MPRLVSGRRRLPAVAALVALGVALTGATQARAEAGLTTGFSDSIYKSDDGAERDLWFDRSVALGSGIVRINVSWAGVAPSRPDDPIDPADPEYDFSNIDPAVIDARERGLEVLLTVYKAPRWAEGSGRGEAPVGTWRPDPVEYGMFGSALATRYSGEFDPGAGVLPRVRYFQAWNEPTLSNYLSPQYAGGKPRSPAIYRRLLNEFFLGVHSIQPGAQIVTAGAGPYGGIDSAGNRRLRPLEFWRSVFCLKPSLKRSRCPERARFDILDHHPINTSGGPRRSAIDPDDVSTPDMGSLRRVLRAAERAGTVLPANRRRPLWASEIWWASNPPEKSVGVAPAKHARWLEEALYVLWKEGVRVVVNLQIVDSAPQPGSRFYATGVYFRSGKAKPAARAWRFPFVTERRGDDIVAWGRSPEDGKLRIEVRRGDRWQPVRRLRVDAGEVFLERLGNGAGGRLRARIGSSTSLIWIQR